MGRPSKHSKEFKEEAVNLALSTNRSRSDIAASLGVNKGTLGNWIRAAEQAETPPKGSLNDAERDELSRLRKEVRDLRQDRDILRKAAAYFATETIR